MGRCKNRGIYKEYDWENGVGETPQGEDPTGNPLKKLGSLNYYRGDGDFSKRRGKLVACSLGPSS